jgi:fatty acid desaturase
LTHVPAQHDPTRARLAAALGDALPPLRLVRALRRAGDFAVAAALWATGAALAVLIAPEAGAFEWPVRILGILVAFGGLNILMLLSHEGHHGLLARRPIANALLSLVVCAPLLHAPSAYRVLHTLHHRHLGGPGDPDEYTNYAKGRRLWIMHWLRLTLGPIVYIPLIPVVGLRRARGRDRWQIAAEYGLLLPVWIAVFLVWPISTLAWGWLVPGLMVAAMNSVRGLTQHTLTDPRDATMAARTVLLGPLGSFLLLNENLHLEHHLFPDVPSYNLKALHKALGPHLPVRIVSHGYLSFLASFLRRAREGDTSVLGATS